MSQVVSRHEWSEFDRGMIWGCWLGLGKKSIRKVAEVTGIPKSTCHDIIKKFEEEGVKKPSPRPGRPRILTSRDDRHLVQIVEKNPLTEFSENLPKPPELLSVNLPYVAR